VNVSLKQERAAAFPRRARRPSRNRRFGWLMSMAFAVGSCSSPARYEPLVSRPPVVERAPPVRTDGAIYDAHWDVRLFEDLKARRIGDLLTIELEESTSASKSAKTSTKKTQETEIAPPTVLGRPVTVHGTQILDTSLSASRDFDGQGDSSQSNRLFGNITVTVVDRLPNGNLVVQGEKQLGLNQGEETIVVSGIVRVADIGPSNVVPSYKLADARISYKGQGFVADSNRMGWLARFFNSGWAPY
jgi:flagellar L-ring protein precursor FlgH